MAYCCFGGEFGAKFAENVSSTGALKTHPKTGPPTMPKPEKIRPEWPRLHNRIFLSYRPNKYPIQNANAATPPCHLHPFIAILTKHLLTSATYLRQAVLVFHATCDHLPSPEPPPRPVRSPPPALQCRHSSSHPSRPRSAPLRAPPRNDRGSAPAPAAGKAGKAGDFLEGIVLLIVSLFFSFLSARGAASVLLVLFALALNLD